MGVKALPPRTGNGHSRDGDPESTITTGGQPHDDELPDSARGASGDPDDDETQDEQEDLAKLNRLYEELTKKKCKVEAIEKQNRIESIRQRRAKAPKDLRRIDE